MKRSVLRKQHKWLGLVMVFFILMFAMSGIVLNHRGFYSKVNVSRKLLPSGYVYEHWNQGLLRGTLPLDSAAVLIYGRSGIWKAHNGQVTDFNRGLPEYADHRVVQRVVMMPDSSLIAACQYGLYRLGKNSAAWESVDVQDTEKGERFADVESRGDSLVLLSRNGIYFALPPYHDFKRMKLPAADNHDGRVSLFRVVWLLHNGAMFGLPGRIVLDLLGVAMILLSLTGVLLWFCPKLMKQPKCIERIGKARFKQVIRSCYTGHKKAGVWTLAFLLFVTFTGWCLRPPMLIPLALNKVPGIPHTAVSPNEPWRDKLRAIRYDSAQGDWLLSTSDGFFSLPQSLTGQPQHIPNAPHVSVMGVNVLQKNANGDWLVGSLSGMWRWNRNTDKSVDFFTSEPMPQQQGSPFGKTPISGYSCDFKQPVVAEYYKGVSSQDSPSQPATLRNLPMSVWQLALEIHTGRIYSLFGLAPLLWVFIAGLAVLWVLWTGWRITATVRQLSPPL